MIQIYNKTFTPYISEEAIQNAVEQVAIKIQRDLIEYQAGKPIYLLGVLNGSFRFMADLVRYMQVPLEIGFVRLSSYAGIDTTGKVQMLAGLPTDMAGKHVFIIEDIIDTGTTLEFLIDEVGKTAVASCQVIALLSKPSKFKAKIDLKTYTKDYICFEIPDDFVVGYGLDYDGLGRELNDIYQLHSK